MATTQDFLRSASRTAHYYGFSSVDTLREHPSCKNATTSVAHHASAQNRKDDSLYGLLTAGITHYFDHKLNAIQGPSLFYTIDKVPRAGDIAVSFNVVNVQKSIAEALLIQTIRSFLADIGYTHTSVRINSLGDTESIARYSRDLTNFLRKRIEDIPPTARELMKQHPCLAYMHLLEKNHELCEKAPNTHEYLSDSSRKHFREIVEYLDMSQTPFEIDTRLMGHHECYSDTLFAVDILDENFNKYGDASPVLARGGRYDAFVTRMSKERIPATGAVVILKNKKAPDEIVTPRSRKTPNVYFAHLGFGPKVRSLLLIEELRKVGIQVHQNIISDSLSEQLRRADSLKAEYAVILGHKEYMENSIIIRNLREQSQECVPIQSLIPYLKKVATV